MQAVRAPTLTELLKSDLTRFYHFNGNPNRQAHGLELWRNFVNPRCAPITFYRLAHNLQHKRLGRPFAKLLTWLNFFLYGIEIDARCTIGPGCYIPHSSGTVIGAQSIGAQALIYQQVTLGGKVIQFEHSGRPVVGDNVILGSGAKVLGDIRIGNNVTVGPNSVVMESLPDLVTVLGIPAKVIRSKVGDSHNV